MLASDRTASAGLEAECAYVPALRRWLRAWPGVRVVTKARGASFQVGHRIFAFTRPDGLAMKLPEERIRTLMEERDAAFLTMGQRTMREWMLLRLAARAPVGKRDVQLLREARDYAARS